LNLDDIVFGLLKLSDKELEILALVNDRIKGVTLFNDLVEVVHGRIMKEEVLG